MGMIHLASSAKSSLLVDNSVEGRSFMKMRNSTGPRMLPWGTPEIMLITKACLLSYWNLTSVLYLDVQILS